eukprot:jgi/Picsp_1/618/NSC_00614-R1_rieske domain-containing isoform 1
MSGGEEEPGTGNASADTNNDWVKIAEKAVFDQKTDDRYHTKVGGRYVSVIRYKDALYCLDSVCFHAGGPLGLGDIEDVAGDTPCLTGEKWYQAADPGRDGKLQPGEWKSVGVRQRRHSVEMREDGLYVKLSDGGEVASDSYATKADCGERIKYKCLRMRTSDGSRSPQRSSSPCRGSTPPMSPRKSCMTTESEDVWPEDFEVESGVLAQNKKI